MNTNKIPVIFNKLREIINQVHELSHDYDHYKYQSKDCSENVLYFTNKNEENILCFGLWMIFWEAKKNPLCLSVDKENFSQKSIDVFQEKLPEEDESYIMDSWIATAVNIEILESDSTAEKIWEKELKPLLDEML